MGAMFGNLLAGRSQIDVLTGRVDEALARVQRHEFRGFVASRRRDFGRIAPQGSPAASGADGASPG
jgi:hypothetical protein